MRLVFLRKTLLSSVSLLVVSLSFFYESPCKRIKILKTRTMTPSILLGFLLRDLVPHLALSSQLHRPWTSVTTVKKLAYHKGFIGIAISGCRRNGAPKRGATFPSFRLSWCGRVIESSQWDMLYVLPVLAHRNSHVWSWTLFSSPWA